MRFFYNISLIAILLWACSNPDNASIKGVFENSDNQTVVLRKIHGTLSSLISNKKMDKQGQVSFFTEVSAPSFYTLQVQNAPPITLLLDSGEHIKIYADIKDFWNTLQIKGSLASSQILYLDSLIRGNHSKHALLEKKFTDFVMQNPGSFASIYACLKKYNDATFIIKKSLPVKASATFLSTIYPHSTEAKRFFKYAKELVKREQQLKLQHFIQSIPATDFPELALPDVTGKTRYFSKEQARYTLLLYWSPENTSTEFIENLHTVYNTFRKKGFNVYAVAITDTASKSWETSIKKHSLGWVNVQGNQHALTSYNIQNIPMSYLFDKNKNAIIYRNLNPVQLQTVLTERLIL